MQRNYLYDNTKFLMIFLVVFGHMLEPLAGQGGLVRSLYLSIYSFHMPVFVLLCGLLTKPDSQGDPSAKIIQSLLVPFLAFTLLYELFNLLTTGRISHYSAGLQPYWLLWFLFSLFWWRLLAPFFMKLKYPLPIAFALALAAGYSDQIGYFLGLSRTLFFFPFFLVGQQMIVSGFDVTAWRRRASGSNLETRQIASMSESGI
jgi:fucose 4-O-acetylase-like acetyltransferase